MVGTSNKSVPEIALKMGLYIALTLALYMVGTSNKSVPEMAIDIYIKPNLYFVDFPH